MVARLSLSNGSYRELTGQKISTGDTLLLKQESQIQITDAKKAEILVFDLAP
jgi:hypothetical protein